MNPLAQFWYLNHRGSRRLRRVLVDSVEFVGNPGHGYQPGWFLSGWDLDKCARRSFALSRIEPAEVGADGVGYAGWNKIWRNFKLLDFGLVPEVEATTEAAAAASANKKKDERSE